MEEVRAQAERMVQRTEIVRQANQVAQRILDDANEEARRCATRPRRHLQPSWPDGDRAGPPDPHRAGRPLPPRRPPGRGRRLRLEAAATSEEGR